MPNKSGVIKISPALAYMFARHNDNVYRLSWYHGIIRTYGGKMEIAYKIASQYNYVNRINAAAFRDRIEFYAVKRLIVATKKFLDDFAKLSHGDIELIKCMTAYEAFGFPVTTINNQPIEKE